MFSGATVVLTAYLETKSHGILGLITGTWGLELPSNLLATARHHTRLHDAAVDICGGARRRRYDTRYTYLVFHAIVCRWPSQWRLPTIFGLSVSLMPISFFSWGCSRAKIPLLLGLVPRGYIIKRMV